MNLHTWHSLNALITDHLCYDFVAAALCHPRTTVLAHNWLSSACHVWWQAKVLPSMIGGEHNTCNFWGGGDTHYVRFLIFHILQSSKAACAMNIDLLSINAYSNIITESRPSRLMCFSLLMRSCQGDWKKTVKRPEDPESACWDPNTDPLCLGRHGSPSSEPAIDNFTHVARLSLC